MASYSARLEVNGQVYPVVFCTYGFAQATDERGRASARVRHGHIELVLDVPENDQLLAWAARPYYPLDGHVLFFQANDLTARETLLFKAGQCVGYQEIFESGAALVGSYRCLLTISAAQLEMLAGSPGGSLTSAGPAGAAARAEVAASAPSAPAPATAAVADLARPAAPAAQPATYVSAATKPRGMPLSPAEVAAQYGQPGVDLVRETQAEALRLGTTESAKARGPVLTGVKDPLTGATHFGQNVKTLPEDLHPILSARLTQYKAALANGDISAEAVDLARAGTPGTHAEIMALDKALKAREVATGRPFTDPELGELLLHNRSLVAKNLGEGVPPRCANCWHLTSGVRVIGND